MDLGDDGGRKETSGSFLSSPLSSPTFLSLSLSGSFERYIRICYFCQLRSTSLLTEENVKFYKVALVLFPILFYLPKWFEIR